MRLTLTTGLIALLVMILYATSQTTRPEIDASLDPEQLIQDASELVLLTMSRTCMVQTEAKGLLGSTQATGYIRATLWVGTDLSQATVTDIDHSTKQISLVLVLPSVMQVTLDHHASRVACEREGLWPVALGSAHEAELTQQLFDQAHRELAASPLDPLLQRRAKLQAQVVLQQLFEGQGWRVHVTWRS